MIGEPPDENIVLKSGRTIRDALRSPTMAPDEVQEWMDLWKEKNEAKKP